MILLVSACGTWRFYRRQIIKLNRKPSDWWNLPGNHFHSRKRIYETWIFCFYDKVALNYVRLSYPLSSWKDSRIINVLKETNPAGPIFEKTFSWFSRFFFKFSRLFLKRLFEKICKTRENLWNFRKLVKF